MEPVQLPTRPERPKQVTDIPTPAEVMAQLPELTAAKASVEYLQTFHAAIGTATVERHEGGRMSPRVTVAFPWPPEPITPPSEASVKAACEVIEKAGWMRMEDRPTGMRDARKIHVWAGNEPVKS